MVPSALKDSGGSPRKLARFAEILTDWYNNLLECIGEEPCTNRLFMERLEFGYDSFMVSTPDLQTGEFRLYEVDWRVVVPNKKRVLLRVTRVDVIHRWRIPSLGLKLDGVPGKHNLVQFIPRRLGVFYGQCSELCGINHSYIPIVVEVIRWEDFVN